MRKIMVNLDPVHNSVIVKVVIISYGFKLIEHPPYTTDHRSSRLVNVSDLEVSGGNIVLILTSDFRTKIFYALLEYGIYSFLDSRKDECNGVLSSDDKHVERQTVILNVIKPH